MNKFTLIFAIFCMFNKSLQHQGEDSKHTAGSYLLYLLIGDIHGVKDDITGIEQDIKELKKELYSIANATDDNKDDISELKMKINKHSSEISHFRTEITGLGTEIEQHGIQINGQRKEYIELKNETTEQQNTVSELTVQMSDLISELSDVKDELADQKYKIMDQQATINNLTRRFGTKKEAVHDCKDILDMDRQSTSGVYEIIVNVEEKLEPLEVYCDMDTDGGGWTVFQKRFDGSVDFYQNFHEYENGFGSLSGEFWLGLKWVYYITKNRFHELRVDVVYKHNGANTYETYSNFSLGSPPLYRLHVSKGAGTAGDGLYRTGPDTHNGQAFTTKDRDNDIFSRNCAEERHGGYWYYRCTISNLNGKNHLSKDDATNMSFRWIFHVTASELKFRSK